MFKVFKFINILSIDVVIGAVICSNAFWSLQPETNSNKYLLLLILGISTWLIYIIDRLFDVNYSVNGLSERHLFFKRHYFNFQLIAISLATIGLVLCFFIPTKIILLGLINILFLVVYFALIRHYNLKNSELSSKEIITSIIYTIGIIGAPFMVFSSINLSFWILALMLFVCVFQEILWHSVFEFEKNPKINNLASRIGLLISRKLVNACSILVLFVFIFFFGNISTLNSKLALIFAVISLSLSFSLAIPKKIQKNDTYLIFGELLFWLPFLLIFFY